MRTKSRAAIAGVVVLACAVTIEPVAGGLVRQDLPDGRALLARHVEAIGGADAYRAIASIRVRGRFAIPAQGLTGDVELLAARPDRLRYRVDVPGMGRIEQGYDGTIGWMLSPAAGPELLAGRQLEETADDAWFDAPLHEPGYIRSATTLSRTEFDGRPAYKVRVAFVSGREQTEYFDVDAGWQIGSEADRATPQGVLATVTILRDYRRFGPLMQATTLVQRALGFEQIVTVTACDYDVVPAGAFQPPPDVLALVGP